MGWSVLGTQFCLELGFGVLLALAFVPRAPVGTLFYRLMGTCAALPLGAALAIRLRAGSTFGDALVLATALALLAYPVYSGPVRGRSWAFGLGLGLLGSAFASA